MHLVVVSVRDGMNVLVTVVLVFVVVLLEANHERAILTFGLPIRLLVARRNPDALDVQGYKYVLKELRYELGSVVCQDRVWCPER